MSQEKEENHLIEERRKKLAELRKADLAFPNDFKRKDLAQELKDDLDQFSKADLEKKLAITMNLKITIWATLLE